MVQAHIESARNLPRIILNSLVNQSIVLKPAINAGFLFNVQVPTGTIWTLKGLKTFRRRLGIL